ncbi:thiosulfate sulfurtransferase [Pseudozyma hubeiensis SY62]|uniref:Thiosulfate sulfurtransferase n=1 Tax=Pseudozyma hubeiensis (strain SY62) TaxID=1305764 RepID=R9PC60_PSEHS|nr:thiosulfate sulfurtransferase [Pseudozyma hubeiensis SY62]GAC98929.1 thiosulfate sulfurtransferase [Pseudozyma hubeiensis SY62]
MRDNLCIPFDGAGRVIQTFRSCGIVAQANGSILTCAKPADMARLALPIIDQCWRRYGDGPCTNWASGVTDSSAYIPKTVPSSIRQVLRMFDCHSCETCRRPYVDLHRMIQHGYR